MSKLAIIGASYLQLPAVLKAKEMGLEVHCFAWAEGAVCKDVAHSFYPISTIDKEAILEKCREIRIDGVMSIASDVAVPTVNYVAAKLGLTGNNPEYSAVMTNKYQMRRALSGCSVPCPFFHIVKSLQDLDSIDIPSWPLIVKPTDRSGSRGVEKVNGMEQLREAVGYAIEESMGGEAIVESFIDGREISVESISWQGKHYILQITDKVTTGAPYFIELAHHQPSDLPSDIQEKVREMVPRALDALHIEYGASHTEIKITPEGKLFIIETGARMGGDFIGSNLVMLSTGYDYLEGVINVALGHFREPVLSARAYSGVYFLSQETARLRPLIENAMSTIPEAVAAEITDPVLRPVRCSADRSGYLIYSSEKGRLVL
ncbi:MAG: ATP-grasp domain-containing protein [Bacteroidales bacterium]|nr:ATP-grasp domain-containing protein [Bacteroidales bacterium]